MNMKKSASALCAAVTLLSPFAAHAAGIDLKQMIKDSVKAGTQQPGAAPASNAALGSPMRKEAPDSNEVAAVLAKLNVPDIAGVKLGMAADEARKILQQANPKFRFEPLDIGWGMARDNMKKGWQATTRIPGKFGVGEAEIVSVMTNEAGTVYFVSRELHNLSPSNRLARDVFLDAAREKFNAPGVKFVPVNDRGTIWYWEYDMAGRQISVSGGSDTSSLPCRSNGGTGIQGVVVAFNTSPMPSCSVMIMAVMSLASDSKGMLLDGYTISMSAPGMRQDANVLKARADAENRRNESEVNSVKTNKPKL